jgi:nonribosomal peptide synthetase protein BlmV
MTELDDRIARLSPDKRELLLRWMAVDGTQREVSTPYVRADTEDERALVEIWQDVLEVDQVGVDDDYFELGGDSVHAIVIAARAQHAGLPVGTQDLFDGRTVRAVAERAAAARPDAARPDAARPDAARPDADPGAGGPREYPLTPLQQGMLYHSVGGSTPGGYVVQARCRLTGDLDRDAFERAWQVVLAANPALGTVLRWSDGRQPVQILGAGTALPVHVVDHTGLGGSVPAQRFAELLEADRRRGFDLEDGPLMRLTVVSQAPTVHQCVWTYHHMIMDGWSQQLVLRDVFDCYRRLRAGRPAAPRSRPSFVEHLAWLAGRPDDDAFWHDRLAGLPGATRVAGPGCVDGRVVTAARPMVERHLPAALLDRLAAFARRNGCTVAALVHAGWALLLCIHTGRDDVVHGATVSGRPPEQPGVTECVGMFVNTLPLRVACPAEAVVVDWLREVGTRLAELNSRQHMALSRVERTAGLGHGSGLFDSIVVVENFPTWIRDGDEVDGLRIDELAVIVEEGYPLVVEFAAGPRPVLRARYDEHRLDAASVARSLYALATCLDAVSADPGITVGALRALVAEAARVDADEARRAARSDAGSRLARARRRPVGGAAGDAGGAR